MGLDSGGTATLGVNGVAPHFLHVGQKVPELLGLDLDTVVRLSDLLFYQLGDLAVNGGGRQVLRLKLCKGIPPGFIPSLFRALLNLPPEVAWDRAQMK